MGMRMVCFLIILLLAGLSSLSFAGEGHDAGYEWAELHGITDVGYDEGNSESFNEGVREYAEERLAEEDEEGSEE